MAEYLVDAKAFVTLRVRADDEEAALRRVRALYWDVELWDGEADESGFADVIATGVSLDDSGAEIVDDLSDEEDECTT